MNPVSQFLQLDDPSSDEYFPESQSTQEEAPLKLYFPLKQLEHSTE